MTPHIRLRRVYAVKLKHIRLLNRPLEEGPKAKVESFVGMENETSLDLHEYETTHCCW